MATAAELGIRPRVRDVAGCRLPDADFLDGERGQAVPDPDRQVFGARLGEEIVQVRVIDPREDPFSDDPVDPRKSKAIPLRRADPRASRPKRMPGRVAHPIALVDADGFLVVSLDEGSRRGAGGSQRLRALTKRAPST